MAKKIVIKIEASNLTNAIKVVETLGVPNVKLYEIELQRIIEDNIRLHQKQGSWWKYTNKRILPDLVEVTRKSAEMEPLVLYITDLFDEVYKNIK